MKKAKATRHLWLVACDANMSPEDFEKSMWFQREADVYVVDSEGGVDLQSQKAQKVSGSTEPMMYIIASNSLREKITQMEVVEDFESTTACK